MDEILKKKMNLENVKDCGDAVCQRSTDPKVSNNMMQLSVKYQGLVSQAKVSILLQIQISLPWYLNGPSPTSRENYHAIMNAHRFVKRMVQFPFKSDFPL